MRICDRDWSGWMICGCVALQLAGLAWLVVDAFSRSGSANPLPRKLEVVLDGQEYNCEPTTVLPE